MAAESHCPAADTLERLLLGNLAEEEAATLENHVLHCGRCTKTLQALRGEDALVQAMRHVPAAAGSFPRGDLVESVIERACRLEPSDGPRAATWGTADTPRDGPATLDLHPSAPGFLAPPELPDEIGRLGPYRVLRVLGGGGMGIVFQAEDPQLRRCVALKVLKPALASIPTNRERFLREARAVAALEHDHVVAIHQVSEDRGLPFLAMALLHGETLEERLQRQSRLPVAEVLRVGREIAEALAFAHAHGLIHRDVKPANIWLEAGSDRVKVLDFGLVRGEAEDTHLTQEGVVAGTPAYMAPEQVRGQPGPRSDLFSLGCVLYRLCTGVQPFRGPDTMAVLAALAQDRPAPPRALNPAVTPALSDLVLRLLAKRPEDRPASASDVAAALQNCASPPRQRRRLWLGLAAAAAAALLLVAGTVLYVNTGEGKLILEVNEPDVKVTVNGKDIRIQSPRDSITLAVGRHKLRVTKDGFTTYTEDFAIRRGGKVELTARLTRLEPPELRPAPSSVLPPELAALARRLDAGLPADPADRTVRAVRNDLLAYAGQHRGTAAAVQAAGLMARLPWPLDALRRERIPAIALAAAGDGDPAQAPAGLVAVWGDSRWKDWCGIHTVAYSPDGKTLATAGWTGAIDLCDVATGRPRRTLHGHKEEVWSVAYSPDGKTLASGSMDGTVKLWDLGTGKEQRTLRGHGNWVFGVAFRPNGKVLASAGRDGTARLWDLASGRELYTLHHTDEVFAVAFDPGGKVLATASKDMTVKLWDADTGQEQATLPGHKTGVRCLAVSRDGKALASAGWDGMIRLWDLPGGTERNTLSAPAGVDSVAFSPDGKTLATASNDGRVRLWDPATGQQRRALDAHYYVVLGLAFSPDGRTLATGGWDHSVKLWNVADGRKLYSVDGHDTQVRMVTFSPNGQTLASVAQDGLLLRDAATGQPRCLLRRPGECLGLAISPDGATLAVGYGSSAVEILDAATGKLRKALTGHQRHVRSVAFSPDGKTLASGSFDQTVKLWDLATGTEQVTLTGHRHDVYSVAFSPDGKWLASGSLDDRVLFWDVATGQQRREWVVGGAGIVALAFSPDGQTLAVACRDGAVKLWDMTAGQERRTDAVLRHGGEVLTVAYSPDGRLLASAGTDAMVRVWDAQTGVQQHCFRLGPPRRDIYHVAFSPDGRHLATANGNGTVYVFRLAAAPEKTAK